LFTEKLDQSLAWRAENQIDNISAYSNTNEAIKKYMPVGIVSRNQAGHPRIL